ncbi:MAG: hypothetical protein HY675_23150 [Chloroflexi bacterium]|nr:hypothetical protein [Chloroflexota bacterium]
MGGTPNIESIAFAQDWFLQRKLVEQKVDMSKIVNNQFVDYAIGVLGKYE